MKFSIRNADKIVGTLVLLALVILIAVIFLLGRNQRWFARDSSYITYFNSASGISSNMAIQYKGFTIGHVKKISLAEDDKVEVIFNIFEEYSDRVREGSLVEINISPIGLGSSFLFHPGRGEELLPDGSVIPEINSPEAKRLIVTGLTDRTEATDSISLIMNQVRTLLDILNVALAGSAGAENLALGQIVLNLDAAVAEIPLILQMLNEEISGLVQTVVNEVSGLNPVIRNLEAITVSADAILDTVARDLEILTGQLVAPDGTVMSILDGQGPIYTNLVNAIASLAGIIENLDRTIEFIPAQLPQLGIMIADLNAILRQAQDVLVAVANNPLLRGGMPDRQETGPGGANPRNLGF